jgi:hypothetical protein
MQMGASESNVHDTDIPNGIAADQLRTASWRRSGRSNPTGCCVDLAELPGGRVAMRNSRHPDGPALIYSRAQISAFVAAAKNSALTAPDSRYC